MLTGVDSFLIGVAPEVDFAVETIGRGGRGVIMDRLMPLHLITIFLLFSF